MICTAKGDINHRIAIIGHPVYPGYVLKTQHINVMIEAGLSFLGPAYLQSLTTVIGDYKNLDCLLVTHSHYDHMGALPYLARQIPNLDTAGPGLFNYLMQRESVLNTMNSLSAQLKDYFRDIFAGDGQDVKITATTLKTVLKEGDRFHWGDLSLEVFETPGHTKDHLSFFIPEMGILFPGEALGNPAGDGRQVKVEFVSSYRDYIQSIEKLTALKPCIIAMSHLYYYTDDDAGKFMENTYQETLSYRELIEHYLNDGNGDVKSAISLMVEHEYDEKGTILMERNAYIANLTGQVKAISAMQSG
jgi:glyoxylase-like metal-dependent hydrolase (beta-lactamase superfamily II)